MRLIVKINQNPSSQTLACLSVCASVAPFVEPVSTGEPEANRPAVLRLVASRAFR